MVTIYREGAFRIWIYTDDHDPAHVHARNADGECRVNIEASRPVIISNNGIRTGDIQRRLRIGAENREAFLIQWRRHHG